MDWNNFCGVIDDMDLGYMQTLGSDIGDRPLRELFDIWPMLFGYPL